jgi:hypothetical protein
VAGEAVIYRLVWLQNDTLVRPSYHLARGEFAAHVYRKAHQHRRYDTRYVVVGPPMATATHTEDDLRALEYIGLYALIQEDHS